MNINHYFIKIESPTIFFIPLFPRKNNNFFLKLVEYISFKINKFKRKSFTL